MARKALIIGCGYTGVRVAELLAKRGWSVTATTRNPDRLRSLTEQGVNVVKFEVASAGIPDAAASTVLLSIPSQSNRGVDGSPCLHDPTAALVNQLGDRPRRVIYLSTTGVYGDTAEVDESTPIAPVTERQKLRAQAEQAVQNGRWPALVLRPAAIYGPGRGVHEAMRRGEFKLLGAGETYVSRIHVDDLATITAAAMASELTGAYPVADDSPSTSREIAQFCADLLGLDLPPSSEAAEVSENRRANRRVDARAIRKALGIDLKYPSYREGIPASL